MKTPVLIPVLILATLLLVMLACSAPTPDLSSDHEQAEFWRVESNFWLKATKFWRDDARDKIDALQVRVEQLETKHLTVRSTSADIYTNVGTIGTTYWKPEPPTIYWLGSMRPPVDTDVHLKFDGVDWHETFRIQ